MIDKRLRKQRKDTKEGGALMLNIRVRHIRRKSDPPATKTAVRDALQSLLDTGSMPDGWQFMYVDWKNPKKYGSSWQSGWPARNHSTDEDEFLTAFTKVVQDQIRMAEVSQLP
jgi:hypothetical protein